MKKISIVFIFISLYVTNISCNSKQVVKVKPELEMHLQGSINFKSNIPFDSSEISAFYKLFPDLEKYANDGVSCERR